MLTVFSSLKISSNNSLLTFGVVLTFGLDLTVIGVFLNGIVKGFTGYFFGSNVVSFNSLSAFTLKESESIILFIVDFPFDPTFDFLNNSITLSTSPPTLESVCIAPAKSNALTNVFKANSNLPNLDVIVAASKPFKVDPLKLKASDILSTACTPTLKKVDRAPNTAVAIFFTGSTIPLKNLSNLNNCGRNIPDNPRIDLIIPLIKLLPCFSGESL